MSIKLTDFVVGTDLYIGLLIIYIAALANFVKNLTAYSGLCKGIQSLASYFEAKQSIRGKNTKAKKLVRNASFALRKKCFLHRTVNGY